MVSGRPPGSSVRFRDLLVLSLLVPVAAALQSQPQKHHRHHQQHHPAPSGLKDGELADAVSAVDEQWRTTVGQQLHQEVAVKHKAQKNTNVDADDGDDNTTQNNKKARISHIQQRALATVSPAEVNDAAVRAPPAQWSTAPSSAGLASRLPARSLQDWQVEDLMLLATVDGKLFARDRGTGAPRWQLEADGEMVQVIRHPHNKTYDAAGHEVDEPRFVIEPSQDGALYVLQPDIGLQRLPYTVKELSEAAPFEETGHLGVTYTAEKKNTLYHIDAKTGNVLKTFQPGGSFVNKDQSCRRVSPLDDSLSDNECETHGTIVLGRTEYTIGIQNRATGEPVETIKYFEWTPNTRDNDLRNTYDKTMDEKYVYSSWNGRINGIDTSSANPYRKPDFTQVFASPVVRVFDIIRPKADLSADASLTVLPQPVPPVANVFAGLEDDEEYDPVYVNRTRTGSWFALSEKQYPSVTYRAPVVTSMEYIGRWHREDFAGVYNLPQEQGYNGGGRLLDGKELPLIDAPPAIESKASVIGAMDTPVSSPKKTSFDLTLLTGLILGFVIAICTTGGIALYKWPESRSLILPQKPSVQIPLAEAVKVSEDERPVVRENEPAEEITFAQPPNEEVDAAPAKVHFEVPEEKAEPLEKTPSNEAESEELVKDGEPKPQKKKATRGRRGGKKQKEKELAQAEAREAKKTDLDNPAAVKFVSVTKSESADMHGPMAINNLVINTDKEIGRGSGGTIVYQGSWENRDVAVKRMLRQYYELASSEVNFLQQSDDHPNVVRYFCQQSDDHFLYIAVELCQASLFDVWEPDRAKTEELRLERQKLKLAIQQDMNRTLQQLAAGLHHLHKLRIIHRDIKPQNILVAYPKKTQPPGTTRLVISDFGLGKNLPDNVSTLIDPTGNVGTSGWKAPELITQPGEKCDSNHSRGPSNGESGSPSGNVPGVSSVKRAADIFSLGCLFFWVLTDGVHPYEDETGWQGLREKNIKYDNKNMDALERWSDAYEPMQLITSMLSPEPEKRPSAQEVLNHPYFWSPERRLAFLCDCSDHFEREPRGVWEDNYADDSDALHRLECRAEEVIGTQMDFLAKLDGFFVQTLGKQRKYTGSRFLDLLRALRNKKNHYEDMSEDVKKRVGPLDYGYLNYWCNRFPRLLMACHEVIQECNLQDSDRFKKYFGLGSE
ncbi:putative serine/threonine-protein kinase, active [Septoria linicola]|nr:putative serine/threonine-protein kinase, active [Septoria linicola]